MRLSTQLAAVAVALTATLAPSAAASPAADQASIGSDYVRHGRITPCRFTKGQLKAARKAISPDLETYAQGFSGALARELKRWADGGCRGKRGGAHLTIVSIRARGGPGSESVTIKNSGRTTVDLRNYALRDAGDHTLKLRSSKLRAGRTLRVVTGCRSGHRGALRRGERYYACRTKEVWDDAGDLVELLGPGGGLLASKRY